MNLDYANCKRRKAGWTWVRRYIGTAHSSACTRVRELARRFKVGGPTEFFFLKFDALRFMASEVIFGSKTSLEVFALVLAW